MGFFSNLASMIGDSVAKTKDVSDEAYLDGLNLDINIICRKIKSESSVVKKNGYGKALKEKLVNMNDRELKSLYEEAQRGKNTTVFNVVVNELLNRELMIREDGVLKKVKW